MQVHIFPGATHWLQINNSVVFSLHSFIWIWFIQGYKLAIPYSNNINMFYLKEKEQI